MREDVADVNDPPSVLDHRDEPVLVSADVENRENIHCIGVRKVGADIDQMFPGGSLGYAVPVQQRFHRVLVRIAEFGDCRFTDDPHALLGYQNGNHCARGFDHAPIPDRHPPRPVRLLAISIAASSDELLSPRGISVRVFQLKRAFRRNADLRRIL
jgi:hypothetical protein